MVVTYYIKLFRTGADRHNVTLMFLLLLAAEKLNQFSKAVLNRINKKYYTQNIKRTNVNLLQIIVFLSKKQKINL